MSNMDKIIDGVRETRAANQYDKINTYSGLKN